MFSSKESSARNRNSINSKYTKINKKNDEKMKKNDEKINKNLRLKNLLLPFLR